MPPVMMASAAPFGSKSRGCWLRKALQKLTGVTAQEGGGTHAHHNLPFKFYDFFVDILGLNPNDPIYGSWWDALTHLQNSAALNQAWEQWIENNPNATVGQALNFARQLAASYGLPTFF